MRDIVRITPQQFEELPQKAKAILVAQDVIAQVREGNVEAKPGHYLSTSNHIERENPGKTIAIEDIGDGGCKACAKGASFISALRLIGPRMLGEVSDGLVDVFSQKTNADMEIAFERAEHPFMLTWAMVSHWSISACAFGKEHAHHKDRLVAIMLNIIRNDGEFRPDDRVTKDQIKNALDLSPDVIAARPVIAAPEKPAAKKARKKVANVH